MCKKVIKHKKDDAEIKDLKCEIVRSNDLITHIYALVNHIFAQFLYKFGRKKIGLQILFDG